MRARKPGYASRSRPEKGSFMTLELFLQHFFNALTLGSLYGLIAIGYTMVYGIAKMLNFATATLLWWVATRCSPPCC